MHPILLRLRKFHRRVKEAYEDLRINYRFVKAGVRIRRATPDEKKLTFGVPDLIDAGAPMDFDPGLESWFVREFPEGDLQIKYRYVFEDEGSLARFLMTTTVEVAPDAAGAHEIYSEGIASMEAAVGSIGARFVFKGNLQDWSENAYAAVTLAQPDETVVGCILSFQKERLVYTITLRGVVFEDAGQVQEFVYPYLDAALAWSESA